LSGRSGAWGRSCGGPRKERRVIPGMEGPNFVATKKCALFYGATKFGPRGVFHIRNTRAFWRGGGVFHIRNTPGLLARGVFHIRNTRAFWRGAGCFTYGTPGPFGWSTGFCLRNARPWAGPGGVSLARRPGPERQTAAGSATPPILPWPLPQVARRLFPGASGRSGASGFRAGTLFESEGALWMPRGSAIVSWTHQTVRRVPLASDRHYPAPPMAASRGVPGSGPGGRNPRPCAGGTARLWRPRRGIGPLERSRRSPGSGFLEATGI
jgi:hypothetical protein